MLDDSVICVLGVIMGVVSGLGWLSGMFSTGVWGLGGQRQSKVLGKSFPPSNWTSSSANTSFLLK